MNINFKHSVFQDSYVIESILNFKRNLLQTLILKLVVIIKLHWCSNFRRLYPELLDRFQETFSINID